MASTSLPHAHSAADGYGPADFPMTGLSAGAAPPMTRALLAWWDRHGRKDPAQKPWMFTHAGCWPSAVDDLDPYGIWIAEVMLHFATQKA